MSETLRRAVQTLDALARADSDLSIREIAEATAVSKSAVQRILSSLVETGLAVQDPASRRYGLGPRTLTVAAAALVGVVVPAIYVIASPRNRGGYNFEYSLQTINAHWVAEGALVLLMVACWRAISSARAARGEPAPPAPAAAQPAAAAPAPTSGA